MNFHANMASVTCGSPTEVSREDCTLVTEDSQGKLAADMETCGDETRQGDEFPGFDMKLSACGEQEYRAGVSSDMDMNPEEILLSRRQHGTCTFLHDYKEDDVLPGTDVEPFIAGVEEHRRRDVDVSSEEILHSGNQDETVSSHQYRDVCKKDYVFPATDIGLFTVGTEEHRSDMWSTINTNTEEMLQSSSQRDMGTTYKGEEESKKDDLLPGTEVEPYTGRAEECRSGIWSNMNTNTEETLQCGSHHDSFSSHPDQDEYKKDDVLSGNNVEMHIVRKEKHGPEFCSDADVSSEDIMKSDNPDETVSSHQYQDAYKKDDMLTGTDVDLCLGGAEEHRSDSLSNMNTNTEEMSHSSNDDVLQSTDMEPSIVGDKQQRPDPCRDVDISTDEKLQCDSQNDPKPLTASQGPQESHIPGENKPYVCGECGHKAGRRCDLFLHMRTHTDHKPYKCDFCEFRTAWKGSLNVHTAKHTDQKRYICGECGFRTAKSSNFTRHIQTHTGEKPYRCDQCDFSSARKGNLDAHRAKHTGEKPYICGECGFRTADRSGLSHHMKTHTGLKPYKCDKCPFCTAWKKDFDIHTAKHTGEKHYRCGECSFKSADKSTLKKHIKTHSGEKPYKCNECEVRMARKADLARHIKTHAKDKPYKCDQCDYSAVQKTQLDKHIAKHATEKPFLCGKCGYSTAYMPHLTRHMLKHTGEKPYKCGDCGYRTADKSNLSRHMKAHQGEKPFKCDQCDYSAHRKDNLDVHMAKHTNAEEESCKQDQHADSILEPIQGCTQAD